jgi:hypothetical protein
MSPEEQLETLEAINGYATRTEFPIPSAVAKAIKPCTRATARMMCQALDLPPRHPWQRLSQGYTILTTEPAWSSLLELNPSLQQAIDVWCGPVVKKAA